MYDDNFKIRYTNAPIAFSESVGGEKTLPHIHCEIEILYVERGESRLQVNGQSVHAVAGELIFINPLEVHEVVPTAAEAYCHKCICFDASLIAESSLRDSVLHGQVLMPRKTVRGSAHAAELEQLFLSFYRSAVNGGATLFLESVGFVSTLFACLMKQQLLIRHARVQENKNFYMELEQYLKQQYMNDISSQTVADAFGYTQSYFCRLFKQCFGVCFSEYLAMYRIAVAKELLEDASKKIYDIAFESGFSSPVHFSRCFKKYVGMKPSDYQKCQYRS